MSPTERQASSDLSSVLQATAARAVVAFLAAAMTELGRDRRQSEGALTAADLSAASSVAETLTAVWTAEAGQRNRDTLERFAASPEFARIVEELTVGLVARSGTWRQDVGAQLGYVWEAWFRGSSATAHDLLDPLIAMCRDIVEPRLKWLNLTSDTLMNTSRARAIHAELRASNGARRGSDPPAIEMVDAFDVAYRAAVANATSTIAPPYVDSIRRLPIDELYVVPTLARGDITSPDQPRDTEFGEFLISAFRAVILGNPGAGKSTLAQRICHELASGRVPDGFIGPAPTPILVTLREYASAQRDRPRSLANYVSYMAKTRYGIECTDRDTEYMLASGRAFLVLDGLDELLDTSRRAALTVEVQALCRANPALPVIVTSREVGYAEAPLNPSTFALWRLAEFSESQARQYCMRWFALDRSLPASAATATADALIDESEEIDDLRSNPLLLSLLCQIYRGESYLPRNRPEIYEKCANMLFEKWDKGRGLYAPTSFEAHLRPALEHIAHWIYSDPDLPGGVTEGALVDSATDYLREWKFDDPTEARAAAVEFVEFCRGRAWVFTDTGTTPEGERLYQFTHRTFLEYFTAVYLVRSSPSIGALAEGLVPHIAHVEWDVVAQMAFQIQNSYAQGAGDTLLQRIVEEAACRHPRERWALLTFASRTLSFLVPRPSTVRHVGRHCVQWCLEWLRDAHSTPAPTRGPRDASIDCAVMVEALLAVAVENRPGMAQVIEGDLRAGILSSDDSVSRAGAELGLSLDFFLRSGPSDSYDHWALISQRLARDCRFRLIELADRHADVASDLVRLGEHPIRALVMVHGLPAAFRSRSYTCGATRGGRVSPADDLLYWVSSGSGPARYDLPLDILRRQLAELGRCMVGTDPPWVDHTSLWATELPALGAELSWRIEDWSPDERFGAAALLFTQAETRLIHGDQDLRRELHQAKSPAWRAFAPVIQARLSGTRATASEDGLAGFTEAQREFCQAWAQGDIDLLTSTTEHRGRTQQATLGAH
jgi:hypothetical protein